MFVDYSLYMFQNLQIKCFFYKSQSSCFLYILITKEKLNNKTHKCLLFHKQGNPIYDVCNYIKYSELWMCYIIPSVSMLSSASLFKIYT